MDEQLQFPGFDEPTPNPDPLKAAKARHSASGGRKRRRQLAEFPELMTVVEAAEYLGVAVSTGYSLTKQYVDTSGREGVPALKVGGRTMVPRQRLAEWLHTQCSP